MKVKVQNIKQKLKTYMAAITKIMKYCTLVLAMEKWYMVRLWPVISIAVWTKVQSRSKSRQLKKMKHQSQTRITSLFSKSQVSTWSCIIIILRTTRTIMILIQRRCRNQSQIWRRHFLCNHSRIRTKRQTFKTWRAIRLTTHIRICSQWIRRTLIIKTQPDLFLLVKAKAKEHSNLWIKKGSNIILIICVKMLLWNLSRRKQMMKSWDEMEVHLKSVWCKTECLIVNSLNLAKSSTEENLTQKMSTTQKTSFSFRKQEKYKKTWSWMIRTSSNKN